MVRELPGPIQEALVAYAAMLRRRFGPRLRLVRLFGSWSRGQARPDSDVDVAVVVDGLNRDEWRQAVSDTCDVEDATGVVLSPLVLSAERFAELTARERRIARDIIREGIAL